MICPKCNTRMKCMETANSKNRTGRRYKCPSCSEKLYTVECTASKESVNYILAEKWQNGGRRHGVLQMR